VFPPDLSQTTEAHLQALVDQHAAEGEQLEFKGALSVRRGGEDRWVTTGDGIGDHARDELLEAVCAFANAEGGHLVLGLTESKTHPRHATAITPVPRVADLAARLRQQITECIEPELRHVAVAAVPTRDDGAGAIVVRVPSSGAAPHRVKTTGEVYRRHGDESRVMIMRDIQELTLQRVATIERRLAELDHAGADFQSRFDSFISSKPDPTIGIHVAAVPLSGPLTIPSLMKVSERFPYYYWDFHALLDGQRKLSLPLPAVGLPTRPILRGCMAVEQNPERVLRLRALQDGRVDYVMLVRTGARQDVPIEWPLALLLNTIATAHELRLMALAPTAEYALAIELRTEWMPMQLARFRSQLAFADGWPFEEQWCQLPRLTLGPITDIHQIASVVASDLHQAVGKAWEYEIEVEPPLEIRTRWAQAGTPVQPQD
jgi:hypothetical protein